MGELIEYMPGADIFKVAADILVNPVNRVGTMGGGLALAFKKRYPEMFKAYHEHCLEMMDMHADWSGHVYYDDSGVIIFNLPTKDHWKQDSDLKLIQEGMDDLISLVCSISHIRFSNGRSTIVAIPKLGSGLGRLAWNDVRPVIVNAIEAESFSKGVAFLILGEGPS